MLPVLVEPWQPPKQPSKQPSKQSTKASKQPKEEQAESERHSETNVPSTPSPVKIPAPKSTSLSEAKARFRLMIEGKVHFHPEHLQKEVPKEIAPQPLTPAKCVPAYDGCYYAQDDSDEEAHANPSSS